MCSDCDKLKTEVEALRRYIQCWRTYRLARMTMSDAHGGLRQGLRPDDPDLIAFLKTRAAFRDACGAAGVDPKL